MTFFLCCCVLNFGNIYPLWLRSYSCYATSMLSRSQCYHLLLWCTSTIFPFRSLPCHFCDILTSFSYNDDVLPFYLYDYPHLFKLSQIVAVLFMFYLFLRVLHVANLLDIVRLLCLVFFDVAVLLLWRSNLVTASLIRLNYSYGIRHITFSDIFSVTSMTLKQCKIFKTNFRSVALTSG